MSGGGNDEIPATGAVPRAPSLDLDEARTSYRSYFHQILEPFINTNCICKTSRSNKSTKLTAQTLHSVFDSKNNFMDDDDDDDEDDEMEQESKEDNKTDEWARSVLELESLSDSEIVAQLGRRSCDFTCFEYVRYVHSALKQSCPDYDDKPLSDTFEVTWNSFKFLSARPYSCDYYGTTVFHYAASDDKVALLAHELDKFPRGVFCVDSKGMTPLMRAVQRSSVRCVKYMLSTTAANPNGSLESTYTPIWFAISNGHEKLTRILLDYNASPSTLKRTETSLDITAASTQASLHVNLDMEMQLDFPRSNLIPVPAPSGSNLTLFSPFKASIMYVRFNIMSLLLEYGANIEDLFDEYPETSTSNNDDKRYVEALYFFHRQFSSALRRTNEDHSEADGRDDFERCLAKLDEFTLDVSIWRRMLIAFIRHICHMIQNSLVIGGSADTFVARQATHNTTKLVLNATAKLDEEGGTITMSEYLQIASEFFALVDLYIGSDLFGQQRITGLTRYLKPNQLPSQIFNFAKRLVLSYFAPKSLKDLCRFAIRQRLFAQLNAPEVKFTADALKGQRQEALVDELKLPNAIKKYILQRNVNTFEF